MVQSVCFGQHGEIWDSGKWANSAFLLKTPFMTSICQLLSLFWVWLDFFELIAELVQLFDHVLDLGVDVLFLWFRGVSVISFLCRACYFWIECWVYWWHWEMWCDKERTYLRGLTGGSCLLFMLANVFTSCVHVGALSDVAIMDWSPWTRRLRCRLSGSLYKWHM